MKSRFCLIFILMILSSCASQKKFAYDFVRKSKGAEVAFYVPNELLKNNIRKDCQAENLYDIELEDIQDTIDARTKIVNKIDEKLFLDVLISSFESTLQDYGLSLVYWEDEIATPDSLHWVVDLSQLEILEYTEYEVTTCGPEGNYEIVPVVGVNVATWFDLINDGEKANLLFTEQNLYEQICNCYYAKDSLDNLVVNVETQSLVIENFYDFVVALGRLYAGYSFDYFMNNYVKKEFKRRDLEYPEDTYLRYDPYEMYIYYTRKDKFIEL